ncbi:transcription-repair coupling factor (superfamily II helicase) [Devosia enhydra]|uniref:Transcription-repair-coupling factor n=1 Tax=Devosia enhydra TaxID=665118 RepID=A0A1K2HZ97_9HYPH|nr:DEAD/DEAH box helicase [Devosia enhydra]SFZ85450.1 transcription-repair coupling factor (superfamily II helicase) [Devosia enhydra]
MTTPTSSAPLSIRMEPVGLPREPEGAGGGSGQPPAAGLALRLATGALARKGSAIVLVSSERRAEESARALAGFLPGRDVLYLPAWDCLPYDRAPPAREIMGKRMSVLRRCLASGSDGLVIVLSPEAALQKLPPIKSVRDALLTLKVGDSLDREALEAFALASGYTLDDRVDEPGEIALRGQVVDIFPADADEPVRISDAEGSIVTMMRYDPRTQRTLGEIDALDVGPASELIAPHDDRRPGDEHRLAEHHDGLATLFDYLPKARFVLAGPVDERLARVDEQIREAHATARQFGDAHVPDPSGLYLDLAAFSAARGSAKPLRVDAEGLEPLPAWSRERFPGRALAKFIDAAEGARIVLCGTEAERRRLQSLLKRNGLTADGPVEALVQEGEPGLWLADIDIDAGFRDTASGLVVIAAADVLGSRAHVEAADLSGLIAPLELRVGDVVVHEDYGVGILRDLSAVEADGAVQDTIQLGYHGETKVMVPVADFGKLWRYGAEADAVTLDRLNTDAWAKKRASVSVEIEAAARGLAELAQQRLGAEASVLKPPKADYDRLAARFPYVETPDQAAAIASVQDDLASGHPMNRLVCGDVGFGKTEIALRAAAAAALAGRQVAVVAPTTVLVRQHLQSFERRFAGTDITIGTLSRLNTAAETAATKEGLRTGQIRIVVATHAIAAADVEMPELGLVIIDEEQRFGAKLKQQLHDMAAGIHLLSMTATPIPRSLQAALVGLQEVSVLATPPARRRPIRTFLSPFDGASARTALLREARRGGQSFVVVPRIEDIAVLERELARLVPELAVTIAHGGLKPGAIDKALMDFTNGAGDILLATNIIESGLDVPRANTMLVWRADRFGLSQLHQLRGRVGRGRSQGVVYLFVDPDQTLAESTRARLSTLEAFDRLGSGFHISARDLELRGAGDLLGEDQAGHVHLIGSALYQQLLEEALAAAKGEPAARRMQPRLNIGLSGQIPPDYVPEAVVRINLYARLQRLASPEALEDFAGELEDRFGPLPEPTQVLLDLAGLGIRAGALGIAQIDAGALGIALTPEPGTEPAPIAKALAGKARLKDGRLIFSREEGRDLREQLSALLSL